MSGASGGAGARRSGGIGAAVKTVTTEDIVEIIGAGLRDFRTAPKYGLFFGFVYAAAGWLLLALLWYFKLPFLAYPLAMGFALIAPFAVVGLYAVSHHLEAGKPLSWSAVFSAIGQAARRDLRWMALVTGFALVLWMDIAAFLFFAFMGFSSFGPDLLTTLFSTPTGIIFLLLGNLVGALIALFVFSISAVSFPMLYDRDIDFVTAMVTSVRLVITNPVSMIVWCILIGLLTVISLASVFVGLIIVLPIIGHATWHLYRRAVEPAQDAAQDPAATAAPSSGPAGLAGEPKTV
jgi:uncharacterized membrane protein